MPFLTRKDVPKEIRSRYEDKHRAKLKAALSDPTISPSRRAWLRDQLQSIGGERIYRADTPPLPGAVVVQWDMEALLSMLKTELTQLAENRGLEVKSSWTKAKIAETIMAFQEES